MRRCQMWGRPGERGCCRWPAGGSHTLAICETGELWACGRGRHGQLGFGSFEDVTTMRPIASLRQGAHRSHRIALLDG